MRTVSIVVNDSYPGIEGFAQRALPGSARAGPGLAPLVVDALASLGVVGTENAFGCDASLAFEVEGWALSSRHAGDAGRFTSYGGAAYAGIASFSMDGLDGLEWDVSGRVDPPSEVLPAHYPAPVDAPFAAAFFVPVLTTFAQIWGPAAAVEIIGTWPEFDRDALGEWVAGVAGEVIPRLLAMRLSGDFDISMPAYDALAQIVDRRAVPDQERSRIVRTLIADMDSPYHYAGQALGIVAQPQELGYYASEDGRTYLGPWEPERWEAWADAHGY